ncbi:hypothetical protein PHSY_007315 [Pseudozyma hubeiensis SY62]|uniref:Uncharacterized protein n=1 Tax=Pseudozyma hubeiensis (strain SY62) TaxID=1305764 RepID=R9PEM8_PSEHS|nr:hypothetical protein PHSY_007315 [Pseudozyma hubeiensis SY62]GAC99712.1 hypothetical protein PHSY_007315 [Pseudozyma hubeiensis SY62]
MWWYTGAVVDPKKACRARAVSNDGREPHKRPISHFRKIEGTLFSSNQKAPCRAVAAAQPDHSAERSEKEVLRELSKHLMTRLQYANFKVEHGWSKQSLSEVENLYYRQNQSGTSITASTAAPNARKSTSTSPNNNNNNTAAKAASTPGATTAAGGQAQGGVGSRLFKEAAVKKIDIEGGDVFGGYGLATPPASAGSVPGATSYLTSKRGRSVSSTPISPPNTSTNSSASKAGDAQKRSPNNAANNNNNNNNASRSAAQATSSTASAAAGGATSYADFWSRVGSSTVSTAGPRSSISPSKKRSADQVAAESSAAEAPQPSGPVSPHKRVRMEPDADRSASSSPAKAALSERGPSFAANSSRRH